MAWLTNWQYRKQITIQGSTGAGTNYQVLLKVGESSGATGANFHVEGHSAIFPSGKNDSGDLRFTASDGTTLLDFWVEKVEGTSPNRVAYCWNKVSADLGTNQNIYCYYGNSSATNVSNGTNTFVFFDDFDGTSLDTTKWDYTGSVTVSNGVATINPTSAAAGIRIKNAIGANQSLMIETRRRNPYGSGTDTGTYRVANIAIKKAGTTSWGAGSSTDAYWTLNDDTEQTRWYTGGAQQQDGINRNGWWRYRVIWSNDTVKGFSGEPADMSIFTAPLTERFSLAATSAQYAYYSGGWIVESITVSNEFANGLKIEFGHSLESNRITEVDYCIARKYISVEPAFSSAGGEEIPIIEKSFAITETSIVSRARTINKIFPITEASIISRIREINKVFPITEISVIGFQRIINKIHQITEQSIITFGKWKTFLKEFAITVQGVVSFQKWVSYIKQFTITVQGVVSFQKWVSYIKQFTITVQGVVSFQKWRILIKQFAITVQGIVSFLKEFIEKWQQKSKIITSWFEKPKS